MNMYQKLVFGGNKIVECKIKIENNNKVNKTFTSFFESIYEGLSLGYYNKNIVTDSHIFYI